MRRKVIPLIALALLIALTAVPASAVERDDGGRSALTLTCDSCSLVLADSVVSFGNWGSGYTISGHDVYFDSYTHRVQNLQFTMFVPSEVPLAHNRTMHFTLEDSLIWQYQTTDSGTWFHYNFLDIDAANDGYIFDNELIMTQNFFHNYCIDPADSMVIEFRDNAAMGWYNMFTEPNAYVPGTLESGLRTYLDPLISVTVVPPDSAIGAVVDADSLGNTVDVDLFMDTMTFRYLESYDLTIGHSPELIFDTLIANAYLAQSGYPAITVGEDSVHIHNTGVDWGFAPLGDEYIGTARFMIDPLADPAINYAVHIRGDNVFAACSSYSATFNTEDEYVFIDVLADEIDCDTCYLTFADDEVAWGNFGNDFTSSRHDLTLSTGGLKATQAEVTYFVKNDNYVHNRQYSMFSNCDSVFSDEIVTDSGTWFHWEFINISPGTNGYVFDNTLLFNDEFYPQDCREPLTPIAIDFRELRQAGWYNRFTSGGLPISPVEDDGERTYFDIFADISVLGENDTSGAIVDSAAAGETVAVPIYLDSLTFNPWLAYTLNVTFDNELDFDSLVCAPHADCPVSTSVYEDSVRITKTGYNYWDFLTGPTPFMTLYFTLDSTAAVDELFSLHIDGDATFAGCQDVAYTCDDGSNFVQVKALAPMATWKIRSVNVGKNTSGYGHDFYLKTNAMVELSNSGGQVNAFFTFHNDASELTHVTYQYPVYAFMYGGGIIRWSQSIVADTVTIQEHGTLISSTDVPATNNFENIGELVFNVGSSCGGDSIRFINVTDTASPYYHLDNRVITRWTHDSLLVSEGNLDLINGFINVTGCGGHGCPALYTWDGQNYIIEDFILTESQGRNDGQPVVDYLPLEKSVMAEDGYYKLQVREFEQEKTYLDELELIVVDYDARSDLRMSNQGVLMTAESYLTPVSAVDNTGANVIDLVGAEDGSVYNSDEAGWMVVTYDLPRERGSGRVGLTIDDPPPKNEPKIKSIGSNRGDLYAEVEDPHGEWQYLGTIAPREFASTGGQWSFNPGNFGLEDQVRIRITWEHQYTTDVQPLQIDNGALLIEHRLKPVQSDHSVAGKLGGTLQLDDNDVTTLIPGEAIDLKFDVPAQPDIDGVARAFFVKARGYYVPFEKEATLPGSYSLEPNYPNPFNPTTSIRYALPASGHVTLRIYNVLGQSVRTLVDGTVEAGVHDVLWDGSDDTGIPVASGVYFYRLTAGDFEQSRKMVLIK